MNGSLMKYEYERESEIIAVKFRVDPARKQVCLG